MRIAHYYFVKSLPGWDWGPIVDEHIMSVNVSGIASYLDGGLRLCVAGAHAEREEVIKFCRNRIRTTVAAVADESYEQLAINALMDCHETYDVVLYAHIKGITYHDKAPEEREWAKSWRRSMTKALVADWVPCVNLLRDGYEAVGCHWLTPEEFPTDVEVPFFGGNFWWTTAEVAARTPRPRMDNRWDAEAWIGRGPPLRVADLMPGWPGLGAIFRPWPDSIPRDEEVRFA